MKTAKNHKEIGKLIKYNRQVQKLSQQELAKKSELTQPAISNIERGLSGTLMTISSIMQALNLELTFQLIKPIDKKNLASYID